MKHARIPLLFLSFATSLSCASGPPRNAFGMPTTLSVTVVAPPEVRVTTRLWDESGRLVRETPLRQFTLADLHPARYRLDLLRCDAAEACRCVQSQRVVLHEGSGLLLTLREGAPPRHAARRPPRRTYTWLETAAMVAVAAAAVGGSSPVPGALDPPAGRPVDSLPSNLPDPFPAAALSVPCQDLVPTAE